MKPPLSRDLIVEILLRLPVKSLLRFKCVCKEWLSLISDPHFAKSHFDLAAAPTYRILVKQNYGYSVQSIDSESSLYNDSAVLNLHIPLPALHDSKFQILGCCRGFIGFDSNHGLILWNPLTNFNKYIPYYGGDYKCLSLNGLGYDVSNDDYLLVFVRFETNKHKDPESSMQSWVTRLKIFSLKTKSWNRLEGTNFPKVHDGFRYRPYGSYFNGALHWLVLSSDRKYIDAIIAFDLKERSLSEIPMPQDLTMEVKRNTAGSELAIINGCFSLCCNSCSNAMVEIWMMKEYRIESSWTRSIVLSTSDIRGGSFLPMCFTKGGEIIGSINHEELAKFNDKGDLVERQRYKKGIYSQCAVYRENLLSRIVFDKKN